MKKYAFYAFVVAAGGYFAHGVYAHHQEQSAKLAAYKKFPYLDVRDDWCTSRRIPQSSCLTPGNLAKLALQGR